MINSGRLPALIALLSVLLSACGEKTAAGPAAVKVNGESITAAELEHHMKQYPHLQGERKNEVMSRLLKAKIDMELLRQAALKDRLDADEAVRLSLADANRLILANAYLQKQRAAVAKPDASEVKAYYDQHPERFAERKVYDLRELAIQTIPENETGIRAKLGDGTKFDDFVRWLREKKIAHSDQQAVVATEQMREDIVQKLKTIRAGETVTLQDKNRMTVVLVNAVQAQPLTLEQASPAIEEDLYSKRRKETVDSMMKQLHEQASIEYVAPYGAKGTAATGD
jgi:EpsD family peptidyl-prolyl cis-trans isomerase